MQVIDWFRVDRMMALCLPLLIATTPPAEAAENSNFDSRLVSDVKPLLEEYCFACHSDEKTKGDVNLQRLLDGESIAEHFKTWELVIDMLEFEDMPPEEEPQPSADQRAQVIESLGEIIEKTVHLNAGDPGPVTLRRLTSAEYAYTIKDLTGLDLDLEKSFVGEAVGGEGFSNVGEVQFVQDAILERYLEAAKKVASHAIVGSGPLVFYQDPGKTGQEISAINRIKRLYRQHGFRTGAGEGAKAYGLEQYEKAFFAAWRFKHRSGQEIEKVSLASLAAQEGISVEFLTHIWETLSDGKPTFPSSEIIQSWQSLPGPGRADEAFVREQCRQLYDKLFSWQKTLAASTQDDEEYPVLTDDPFKANRSHNFAVRLNAAEGSDFNAFEIRVRTADSNSSQSPAVLWKNPRIEFRDSDGKAQSMPLADMVTEDTAKALRFGQGVGGASIDAHDFLVLGDQMLTIHFVEPEGSGRAVFKAAAIIDVESGDDTLVRCEVTDGSFGRETISSTGAASALLASPDSPNLPEWETGIRDFARNLAQVSHREPTPSDRDWIPAPFDNTYNKPERNYFHTAIKYHRDDRFLIENMLGPNLREELERAWTDLLTAFDYHDTIFRFVLKKYQIEAPGTAIEAADPPWISQQGEPQRGYLLNLYEDFHAKQARLESARTGHLLDVVAFAEEAWRKPLTELQRERLSDFYEYLVDEKQQNHESAIRSLIARVLVAPDFLYRVEAPKKQAPIVALSDFALANRLSYFLWSSKPDKALLDAAVRGELVDPDNLAAQAKRMLADPKSRRLATEFFGQWFGFYRFDDFTGIDAEHFPGFSVDLKVSLYDESVSFFEYIIAQDRPLDEILFADYTFLNGSLAEHYGIPWEESDEPSQDSLIRVEGVSDYNRGGLLRQGSILAVTSAPLRTSAVKRGDWVLRRVLGTPTPPPPADAGSIPAEESTGDGLTLRERLEAHRSDESCVNCHMRIDPLGFALEQYDPVGQWRENYGDGGAIDTSGILKDGTEITGFSGLADYLGREKATFHRNLSRKLLGYALGRSEIVSDRLLIDKMMESLDSDNRLSTLVALIVTSEQFRHQRGNPPEYAQN
jgi:hypothetical protein